LAELGMLTWLVEHSQREDAGLILSRCEKAMFDATFHLKDTYIQHSMNHDDALELAKDHVSKPVDLGAAYVQRYFDDLWLYFEQYSKHVISKIVIQLREKMTMLEKAWVRDYRI
jgi:hypothetical protein